MRALTEVELSCINGSDGNDSYNPTSLIVGSLSTIAKLPPPRIISRGRGHGNRYSGRTAHAG